MISLLALLLTGSAAAVADALSARSTTSASITFNNVNRLLFDTDGNQVDAYGSKVNYFNGSYYLYGNSFGEIGTAYGINSYRSVDLSTWQAEGNILSANLTAVCVASDGGCGRPHMLYNQETATYVLWLNSGSPGYLVATSPSPTGPFEQTARASIDPQFDALQPADFAVESNGTAAYLVFSALDYDSPLAGSIWPAITQTIHISPLTDDYLSTTNVSYPVRSAADDLIDQETESPDLAFHDGLFYVGASNTCGYCNGSIALVYRSPTLQGPWTRQIISGDACRGQLEGILPLPHPATGQPQLVWHSTSVPGGPRTAFSGHIFQPLALDATGLVSDLDCDPAASFPITFAQGTAPAPAAPATDATPSTAPYDPVCDSDRWILYQTWPASRAGTLRSVSLSVARAAQTVPLALTVFTNFTLDGLVAPGFAWAELGTASFNASELSYVFDAAAVDVGGAEVEEGQLLGLAVSGADYSPWCHLEFETGEGDGWVLFQQGEGQYSSRGLGGRTAPVYEREGRSVRFFATYA